MNKSDFDEISELNKETLIDVLTEELPALRAKIGLSQDELSNIIGISRQTYNAIETNKRKMSWNTFLSLILLFDNNVKTKNYIEHSGVYPKALRKLFNIDKRAKEQ